MKTNYHFKIYSFFLLSVFAIMILPLACTKDDLSNLNCSKINSKYSADIKPIITANCLSSGCHGTGSPQGDFNDFSQLQKFAFNGRLEQVVIVDKTMPPSGPLDLEARKKIKCWIESGALSN